MAAPSQAAASSQARIKAGRRWGQGRSGAFGLIFAVASGLAVGAGCFVAATAGVPWTVWARNGVAWCGGAVLAAWCSSVPSRRLLRLLLAVAPVALLASLCSAGQSGVHRWVRLGPFQWNVAFLFLPGAVVAIAALTFDRERWAWLAAAGVGVLLYLQPDASQATAFAAAMIVVAGESALPLRSRAAVIFLCLLAGVIAWLKPDPLAPVAEVEGIIGLARSLSGVLAAGAVAALVAVILSPVVVRNRASLGPRVAAGALSAYLLACAAAPMFGAFPVPLLGMGISPIVGFWIGAGALGSLVRRRELPSS
jgi:hypothetical protein